MAEVTGDRQEESLYHPVVQELCDWVEAAQDRRAGFHEAISTATNKGVTDMDDIHCLSDWFSFLDSLLLWVPSESVDATKIFNRFSKLYFVLDQPSIFPYQSPVTPDSSKEFSFVTQWIIRFNITFGSFMDTPASLTPESLATFEANPRFHLTEYLPPRGGWRSFNEFFARQFKPGYRPIAAVADSSVIVSPVDFTFNEQLEISPSSTLTAKGLTWSISELMVDSPFKDCFQGGTWMHGFIAESDYHRTHAPIGGKVVEARVMSGQHYALIEAMDLETDTNDYTTCIKEEKKKTLRKRRVFYTPNEPGYQFVQGRGLIVLETEIGMVAVLPVGMSVVSSVILTAEEGVTLRKGEEIGYFQFGGSDIVLMFESRRKVVLDAVPGVHYKMGVQIGHAHQKS
jgi:phosphatidylserine decarboxylase